MHTTVKSRRLRGNLMEKLDKMRDLLQETRELIYEEHGPLEAHLILKELGRENFDFNSLIQDVSLLTTFLSRDFAEEEKFLVGTLSSIFDMDTRSAKLTSPNHPKYTFTFHLPTHFDKHSWASRYTLTVEVRKNTRNSKPHIVKEVLIISNERNPGELRQALLEKINNIMLNKIL